MKEFYQEFIFYLEEENKEKAVKLVLDKLDSREIHVVELYTKILAPSLNNMECKLEDKKICIWREHVRSSIIRTIIECCYPYVIKEKSKEINNLNAVIVCPSEEYHEIGARMAADFFVLCGFNTTFVGCNTPQEDLLSAIDAVKPDYVVISVTNYYNLVAAKRVIEKIKNQGKFEGRILVGGYAFKNNMDSVKKVGAEKYIDSFEDVQGLLKEGQ